MGTLTDVNPTPLPTVDWKLTFFDGFNNVYLDRAAWPLLFWGGSANGAYSFQPSNVVLWDGEASVNSASTPWGWTSGAFQQGWNGQLYGRFEVRAKFDPGQGISGAILLWPTDDEGGAEVDLIEVRGADKSVNNITVHGKSATFGNFDSTELRFDATQWHTYAVDWLPGQLVFYLDGQEVHRTTKNVPDEMMSLGILGYVNSPTDLWQGGPPDASSPGFHSIHVDWAKIYTPESLYPGALPPALYGTPGALRLSTEPWTGAWNAGNTGEFARSAVRSVDGVFYAATWNAAQWGDQLSVVTSAPATWNPAYATRLLYGNFADVELDLAAAGATGLSVIASAAQRGNIRTGDGGDTVTWVAHSAPSGGSDNAMTIVTGAGHDNAVVTAAGRSNTDQPFGWGADWRGDYDGLSSVFRVNLGAGEDWATLLAGGGVVDGGGGVDTVVFWGPVSRFAVTALADGSTRVDDRTGAQGGAVLWGVERLHFTDAEIPAPGQAPAPAAIGIAPVGATPVLPVAAVAADWQV